MSQFKIFASRTFISAQRDALSNAIHDAAVLALGLPAEKRFHRFFPMDSEDFISPADRSEMYTVIEVHMFVGRSTETKKALFRALQTNLADLGVGANDLEVTLVETPRENWFIRGIPGDELALTYKVGNEPAQGTQT